ncbi:hypothetical protein ACP70R_036967 [Stipagrostis hirtigluma subsp. patula]
MAHLSPNKPPPLLLDTARFPRLAAWAERFAAADAVREASPAVADIVAFYRKMVAEWNSGSGVAAASH